MALSAHRQLSSRTTPLPPSPAAEPSTDFASGVVMPEDPTLGMRFWREDLSMMFSYVPGPSGPAWVVDDDPPGPATAEIEDPEVAEYGYGQGEEFPAEWPVGHTFYRTDLGMLFIRGIDSEGNAAWLTDEEPESTQYDGNRFTSGPYYPADPSDGDRHFHTAEALIFRWVDAEDAWIHTLDMELVPSPVENVIQVRGERVLQAGDNGTVFVPDEGAVLSLPQGLSIGHGCRIAVSQDAFIVTPLPGVTLNGDDEAVTLTEIGASYHVLCLAPNTFQIFS